MLCTEWVAVRVFAQTAAGLSDVYATGLKRRQTKSPNTLIGPIKWCYFSRPASSSSSRQADRRSTALVAVFLYAYNTNPLYVFVQPFGKWTGPVPSLADASHPHHLSRSCPLTLRSLCSHLTLTVDSKGLGRWPCFAPDEGRVFHIHPLRRLLTCSKFSLEQSLLTFTAPGCLLYTRRENPPSMSSGLSAIAKMYLVLYYW